LEKTHALLAINGHGEIAIDLVFPKRFLNEKHIPDIVLNEKNKRPFLTSTLSARFHVLPGRRL